MENRSQYKTKQKTLIIDCLRGTKGRHFTADDIAESLSGQHVGKTTIYRHLDKLVSEGEVRKYIIDDKSSACYQYIGDTVCEHFHLKCTSCGELIHADCTFLDELSQHIGKEHRFAVDMSKTVFYGICDMCRCDNKKKNGGGTR